MIPRPRSIEIRSASPQELVRIQEIHAELKRPVRDVYQIQEFLIAWMGDEAIGCAGTSVYQEGAYFYGLAVRRQWQRQGVGSELMEARIRALRGLHTRYVLALVMFWNSRFFRKFGFVPVPRDHMPSSASVYPDLMNPALKRSAVMILSLP